MGSFRLMTAEEAATEYNLPSARTLRSMRQKGLPAFKIGRAFLFAADDIEQHILSAKVSTCLAEIPAPGSSGSTSASPTTSSGTKAGVSVAVLLARQTAERLKKRSPTSSANDVAPNSQTGRESPTKS